MGSMGKGEDTLDETGDEKYLEEMVLLKEIDKVNAELGIKDINQVKNLKSQINMKVYNMNEKIDHDRDLNTDIVSSKVSKKQKMFSNSVLTDLQNKQQQILVIKTHIAKFQSEVLAFSLKKYFKRWKKNTEDFKIRQDIEKKKEQEAINNGQSLSGFDKGKKKINVNLESTEMVSRKKE